MSDAPLTPADLFALAVSHSLGNRAAVHFEAALRKEQTGEGPASVPTNEWFATTAKESVRTLDTLRKERFTPEDEELYDAMVTSVMHGISMFLNYGNVRAS